MPFVAAIIGIGLLGLMDAFMKEAALIAGAYTATLLRSLAAAALISPFWIVGKPAWPRGHVLRLHLERGIITAFMALTWFFALTKLPIAEAIAISFVAPLIALYFANVFLGEKIHRNAIFASLLGLAGTLVIVGGRMGRSGYDTDMGMGLAALFVSALLYAYNFIVIRKQSQVAGPVEVATFHSGISGLVLLLAAPWLFTLPGGEALSSVIMAAALTVSGSMAITWAYARAQAQALVPLEYTGFLWGALFGWLFFAETVVPTTLAGAALIVAGSWIARPRNEPDSPAQN